MIKVCGISDMHGILDFNIDECDILCICGDIVPLNIQRYKDGTLKWLKKQFIKWCDKQPCERVFLIAGNHDLIFEYSDEEIRDLFNGTKIQYLRDELTTYTKDDKTINIYGTPWCHQFFDWAFMTDDGQLAEIYDKIPENVDILMTHDCSNGACDILLQDVSWRSNDHLGCNPLANAVINKKPKYQLCGHLHSGSHEFEELGDTKCCNVSMVDERYQLAYKPLYFEI